jgi:hypothetical protein
MAYPDANGAEAPGDLRREEYEEMLDDYARRFLGISLNEFLARLDAGDLPDTFAVADLKTLTGAAAAGA